MAPYRAVALYTFTMEQVQSCTINTYITVSSRAFPWVLRVFEISAYHFYKVIEVAIKVEGGFPRGIIKHLNRVRTHSDNEIVMIAERAGERSSHFSILPV